MHYAIICLAILAGASAAPSDPTRVVGGAFTTINEYPFAAALLYSRNANIWTQLCGGTIFSTRAILTAAHCVFGDAASNWRIRVGSSSRSSGGTISNTLSILINPSYVHSTLINDLAIIRTTAATALSLNNVTVEAAVVPPTTNNPATNVAVWGVGWGTTSVDGPASDQLRHVRIWIVALAECTARYNELGRTIHANNLCAGWLDLGGRGQCAGDEGGPLVHNNLVVGVFSWSRECGHARYPAVHTRVGPYNAWITANL